MSLQITLVQQFEQHRDETWALAFSQDGKQLVSSDGKALYLWRLSEEGIWEYERSLPFRSATFPQFAPHGTMLAFGGKEEFVKLISVDGRELATFPAPSHASWAFSPDQRWLVSSDKKPDILLWDLATYQSSSIPSNGSGGPFLFTPDGQRLVFGAQSPEGYMHIGFFDPEHQRILQRKTFATHGMLDGAISPDGKVFACIISNNRPFDYEEDIYLYDLESLRLMHVFQQATRMERYNLLAFSPDSRYLASSKTDCWVDIFSLDSFDCIAQFAAHPGLSSHATDPIGGLAWSKTGYIATGGASWFEKDRDRYDYSVKIWKVEDAS